MVKTVTVQDNHRSERIIMYFIKFHIATLLSYRPKLKNVTSLTEGETDEMKDKLKAALLLKYILI